MRVLFMGTPDFATPTLRALAQAHEVLAVVTNPDRASGRGRKQTAPAVKLVAQELGLQILQPKGLRKSTVQEDLAAFRPDLIVVVAYGRLLPPTVLKMPSMGCLNVHASLLPAYRGAAPINWAIINGERETGVTIMLMDEGLDTGPTLLKRPEPILPDDTAGTLSKRLSEAGPDLLLEAIAGMLDKSLIPTPQPTEGVSFAPMMQKADGLIDWTPPARTVADRIRGTDPWPGAYTFMDGVRMKLFSAKPTAGSGPAGSILGFEDDALVVACGVDAVAIEDLQIAGKKRMTAKALHVGRTLVPGTTLSSS
ncbi:MAG: methionyl-tRNA formyltransferase [Deltaproteobacteria bacterium]|nr:methionyl-tRNA formyltransferase [Deltaproteobacteria bacterium]